MTELTHLNQSGEAHMVDVGDKDNTARSATAETFVKLSAECFQRVVQGQNKKGDVFSVARIAGIQAAKKCSELIPLCHPLMLTKIDVELAPESESNLIHVTATCKLTGKTGVEMEALTAVSVAALTVYDMCKAVDKGIEIGPTRLLAKEGGRSGNYTRCDSND